MNENRKVAKDKNIASWQLFYLNNLDIFTEDYLEIPLRYFQKNILLDCWKNDIEVIIASRGLSKSFTIGVLAIDLALLLPNVQIGISSMTLGQSNKIIDEKIDMILSSEKRGISPVLKQLRRDGYIKFGTADTSEARIVTLGNGSRIFSVNCGEGGRGSRTNISILDECVLVKKKDYDAIVEPMLEPYSFNGLYLDPKQIFMTSAKTKDKWVWKYLVNAVNNHYSNKDVNYGFWAGDIFTAIANRIQTKKQYLTRKENTSEFEFNQEFLNLWQGESEGCLFSYEMFHEAQNIKNAFIPPLYLSDEVDYEYKPYQIRYMANDLAVSSGNENDNSVVILGNYDTKSDILNEEYITSLNGVNSLEQVVKIKRLFYDYKCDYYVMDSKGIGNVFFDILTVPTWDEERGVEYPAWSVCNDKKLQISSDTVINDKKARTVSDKTEEVIVPIAGTPEINSNMHLTLQKTLKNRKINLLQDNQEYEYSKQEDDPKWVTYSSQEKMRILEPYVETWSMINEAITLNTEYKNGLVKVKEDRSAYKDRYMTLAMFSYFGDKLRNKLLQDDEPEWDIDDWAFLAN